VFDEKCANCHGENTWGPLLSDKTPWPVRRHGADDSAVKLAKFLMIGAHNGP